uniref:Thyrotropin-releasing hormone-degrading ectoenzyme n=1 Tax=Ascaris suum TaxID=6253 RepID=F1KR19_ASCSU
MGNYLNYTYPYIKSDQIGLPEFVAGAMENFGLIVYKYQYVAIHPKISTTEAKQAAAKVICHELAHQWFGNTVTAAWWDDLFLNEGFASFFERFNMKLAIPSQKPYIETKWYAQRVQPSLVFDADLSKSHPLYAYNGPEFDTITYGKGASALRMIYSVLGEEAFQSALQDYIKEYQFSNAVHQNLFDKFTAHSKNITDWCGRPLNATSFLNPWFHQQDFPLVTMTNNQLMRPAVVSQEPFNDLSVLPESDYNYSWPIPFIYRDYSNSYQNPHDTLQWMKPAYEQCPLTVHSRALHWNIGNAGSWAHLRVQYDDVGFARMMDRLKTNRDVDFTMEDQMELIADELALLKRRSAADEPFSYKNLIAVLKAVVPNSPRFGAFEMAELVLPTLEAIFMDGPDYVLFQKLIQKLLEENYGLLGFNVTSDDWDTNIARYNMLPYMVRYEVGTALDDGYKLFQQFITECNGTKTGVEDCSTIHPDVRKAVYCAGGRKGTQDEFNVLLTLFDQQVKNNYYFYGEYFAMLQGMACSTRQNDMNEVIKRGLLDFKYRPTILFYNVLNPKGSQWMAEYLVANQMSVLESANLDEYLDAMTSTWYSQDRLQQLANISDSLQSMSEEQRKLFDTYYNRTVENVEWWNKYYPDLSRVLYDAFVIGPFDMENWNTRLPRYFEALSYRIKIRPHFPGSAKYPWYKNMTFEGSVDIDFTVVNTTTEIKLNSHRMVIEKTNVQLRQQSTGQTYPIDGVVKDLDYAFLTLQTTAPLNTGSNWTLSFNYTGFVFGVPSKGVYTNTNFFEFNGKMAWIFSTYFESGPSARSLLPCFDEPDYKATWEMTLEHPADMIALGNMPDKGFTVQPDGWATTRFSPTPLMSSYLLAVAAGHFASLETVSETDVLIRVWAWTGMEAYAETSLKVVAAQVDFMATYFDCPYPLPKLDMLALPQYTTMTGAEEHWGFIHMAYRRALIDPLYASAQTYADVARVSAHETVHQWYGNLVTMEFWPLIFLNEAFANYWETFGVEKAFPTQNRYNKFERFRKALSAYVTDSSVDTSKPVVPDKPSYFTGIPYNKGASLLHMLSNTISARVLQLGLQQYLKKYQYSNANDVQLWAEITEAARNQNVLDWNGNLLNVQELMDPWIYQATYPVLKVTNRGGTVTYTQEPFITDTSALQSSRFNFTWIIPVFSQDRTNTTFHYFVGADGSNAFWTRRFTGEWQVDNPAFQGFFRVWYDEVTWTPILNQLKSDPLVFDELTRAQLISDAIALQERGSVNWTRVLDLLFTLKDEKELAPWYAARTTLNLFLEMFQNSSHWTVMKAFIGRIVDERYNALAWKQNDDWSYDVLSTYITEWACKVDRGDCRSNASASFKEFVTFCERSKSGTGKCNRMPYAMRLPQYCWGTYMNPDATDVVSQMYRWFEQNSKYFARDSDNLLQAQACTTNVARINALIRDALTGNLPADIVTYLGERGNGQYLWNYFVQHPDEVKYGVVNTIDYMTAAMAQWSNTDQAEQFLSGPEGNALSNDDKQAIRDAEKTVENRREWLQKNEAEIAAWLSSIKGSFYE